MMVLDDIAGGGCWMIVLDGGSGCWGAVLHEGAKGCQMIVLDGAGWVLIEGTGWCWTMLDGAG